LIKNTKRVPKRRQNNLTPGKYPKENIRDSENGENLKSRTAKKTNEILHTRWLDESKRVRAKVKFALEQYARA
jgi:hypothetical protein